MVSPLTLRPATFVILGPGVTRPSMIRMSVAAGNALTGVQLAGIVQSVLTVGVQVYVAAVGPKTRAEYACLLSRNVPAEPLSPEDMSKCHAGSRRGARNTMALNPSVELRASTVGL